MQNQQTTNQEIKDIYKGSHINKLFVKKVTPSVIIPADAINEDNSSQATLQALKYRYPLKYLGDKYKQIIVPCVPAKQYVISDSKHNKQIFQECYIKCQQQTNIKVIASGKRSALLVKKQQNGKQKMIRLKGCGNQLKGFNQQNNQTRGSHYYHTAKRQLYITKHLNQIFKQQLHIDPPANKPLYMYDFPQQYLTKNNITNDLPMINKYCCVFQTQGDRRAGTHLISPLQILYLSLFNHENAGWKQVFDKKQRIEKDTGQLIQFVNNFELFLDEGQEFFQVYCNSNEIQNYISIDETQIVVKSEELSSIYNKIQEKFIHQKYKQDFYQKIKKIKNFIQTIKAIVQRIGWQMGQIKRVMCQHSISWGFFSDHGSQWHCNAHLNNFIVTKPAKVQQNSSYFLLPLDYDLAYKKQQFINIQLDSPKYGQNDKDLFENYMCAEFTAMQMSLFGLQVMNFKYGITEEDKTTTQKKMGRIAYRDTLVNSFNKGMRNNNQIKTKIQENWNNNLQDIQNIVEICLMMSLDFQT